MYVIFSINCTLNNMNRIPYITCKKCLNHNFCILAFLVRVYAFLFPFLYSCAKDPDLSWIFRPFNPCLITLDNFARAFIPLVHMVAYLYESFSCVFISVQDVFLLCVEEVNPNLLMTLFTSLKDLIVIFLYYSATSAIFRAS